jgi:hypothetical protein
MAAIIHHIDHQFRPFTQKGTPVDRCVDPLKAEAQVPRSCAALRARTRSGSGKREAQWGTVLEPLDWFVTIRAGITSFGGSGRTYCPGTYAVPARL